MRRTCLLRPSAACTSGRSLLLRCGAQLTPGSRFCDNCGHKLDDDLTSPPKAISLRADPLSAPLPCHKIPRSGNWLFSIDADCGIISPDYDPMEVPISWK
ncbi:MAG: zinc-ribbon domain-containing protein [Oscillospiraceae bacterium]